MDYNLDIIISERDLTEIGLKPKTFYWGGEVHECIPREFNIEDIGLIEASNGAIYDILIKQTDICEPVVLTVDRRKISVETLINDMKLGSLLRAVSKKKFELYLWKDDESIDYEYEFTQDMDINELLLNTLESDADIRLRNA